LSARLSRSAALFAALGDETRLGLASRLSHEGPLSITRLAHAAPVTRQAIAKHLRVMERAALVRCRRRGRECVWQLDHRRLADASRYLDLISRQWDNALARLKSFVEGS
jgi:DNA-binding transcriptional ArsR family regulator